MFSKKIIVLSVSAAISLSMSMVSMAAAGYVSDGQGWKYYGIDGSVTDIQNTGWLQDQNRWRFISEGDPSNTGISVIDGKLYCFTNDGYLQTGWVQGKYGSLNPVTGESKDNLSGDWYYYGTDGAGVTGWQQIDGKWYYFGSDSIMYRYETTPDGYYVDGNGECTEEGQKLLAELNAIDLSREAEEAKTTEDKLQEVIDFTNEEREKRGLAPLEVDNSLMKAAAIRAEELTESYAHARPNGKSLDSLIRECGAEYRGAGGENIVTGVGNAVGAVESWMRSEAHKENIMNKNIKYIGVGYAINKQGAMYWVQLFVGN